MLEEYMSRTTMQGFTLKEVNTAEKHAYILDSTPKFDKVNGAWNVGLGH